MWCRRQWQLRLWGKGIRKWKEAYHLRTPATRFDLYASTTDVPPTPKPGRRPEQAVKSG